MLAAIGIYGVIAYMVARRTNEIGIRVALGGTPGDLLGLILREARVLLAVGAVAGTLLAGTSRGPTAADDGAERRISRWWLLTTPPRIERVDGAASDPTDSPLRHVR